SSPPTTPSSASSARCCSNKNDEWAVARRYMRLETLARITDYSTIRLPAVVAISLETLRRSALIHHADGHGPAVRGHRLARRCIRRLLVDDRGRLDLSKKAVEHERQTFEDVPNGRPSADAQVGRPA